VPVGREVSDNEAWVEGPTVPHGAEVPVPRDPSSAAFLVVAAVIVPGSEVLIPGVTLNPTRTGFMSVLERMGANVEVRNLKVEGAELVGTMVARFTERLKATVIAANEIASLVDEVPILAVAAARASGTTRFEGVGELRVKESDRLSAIVEALESLGACARAEHDVLIIDGPADFTSASVDSLGDHRLAMAWAVAGLAASGPVSVDRFESVDVSYPSFASDVEQLLS
jgi:3-phosphoshikimate 1-carboxyvinyltransferase